MSKARNPAEAAARRDAVRRMWEAGRTQREIAASLDVGFRVVGNDIRAMSLTRNGIRRGGLAAQFDAFVWPEPNSGCWLWGGSCDHRGYAQIRVTGKVLRYASHVSLEMAGRPVPAGHYACHHCDNPACVNPDHLFVGTPKDNAQDMIRKGRHSPPPVRAGASNPRAVISETEAVEIKAQLAAGMAARGIARARNLPRGIVHAIKQGKTWRHV